MAIWPGLSGGPPGPPDSGPTTSLPRVSARSSREMGPGRSNRGVSRERSMTVDSRPRAVGPLSRIRSIWPSRSLKTWRAIVGEMPVDRLALGAATGLPARAISNLATFVSGTRTPTVSRPAVTTSGIRADRGRTRVKGPGQHASARIRASSGQFATHERAMSGPSAWTIKGFTSGRPLASKIRATAAGSVASAPRP